MAPHSHGRMVSSCEASSLSRTCIGVRAGVRARVRVRVRKRGRNSAKGEGEG